MQELWECPQCGAKLLNRNLSHSCGRYSVQQFLEGKSAHARDLFDRLVGMIASFGPYHLAPAKTRVAFMALVRFASVNRVSDSAIDIHFVLRRKITSARFRRVEKLGPYFVHHLRLTDTHDFDAELRQWLAMSYHEYGQRGWLKSASGGP